MGRYVAYNPQLDRLWVNVPIKPTRKGNDELAAWCNENCIGRWTCNTWHWDPTTRQHMNLWLFKDARDAMLFKLAWKDV